MNAVVFFLAFSLYNSFLAIYKDNKGNSKLFLYLHFSRSSFNLQERKNKYTKHVLSHLPDLIFLIFQTYFYRYIKIIVKWYRYFINFWRESWNRIVVMERKIFNISTRESNRIETESKTDSERFFFNWNTILRNGYFQCAS